MEQMTLAKFKKTTKDNLYKTYLELNKQVQELINENEILKKELNSYKETKVQKIKNERNAGRKQKFTNEEIQAIKQLRKENKSIREIAKEFKCSVGLIHKIINEQKEEKNSK